MNNIIYFKHCVLELIQKDGKTTTTSWLPEKYAIKDKYVELKNRKTGKWINGWKVTIVGTKRLTENQIVSQSQHYRKTREASDI